jgi:hypothetical protein
VWLATRTREGRKWHLTAVSEAHPCRPHAELVAAAFRSLLNTAGGEAQAIEYVRHVLEAPCDHDIDEPKEHENASLMDEYDDSNDDTPCDTHSESMKICPN